MILWFDAVNCSCDISLKGSKCHLKAIENGHLKNLTNISYNVHNLKYETSFSGCCFFHIK